MSPQIQSVSSLVNYIKGSLEHDFQLRWIQVKGEVSNLTKARNGHWYFSLKDAQATIKCVMFYSNVLKCNLDVKAGMSVVVTGAITVYTAGGEVQIRVSTIELDGIGSLFLQLERVKTQLFQEGLFDPKYKKAIPPYCDKIAIVTADTGDALQDALSTISKRWPIANVEVFPSLVQGKQAHLELIQTLNKVDVLGFDVILLIRGGGSLEQLWCFNEEALARCIFACKTPIVTGVGHTRDVTLVDYVSDFNAITPTEAAVYVTKDVNEVLHRLQIQQQKMIQMIQERLQRERLRLTNKQEYRYFNNPMSYLEPFAMKIQMNYKVFEQVVQKAKANQQALMQLQAKLAMHASACSNLYKNQVSMKLQQMMQVMQMIQHQNKNDLRKHSALLDAYSPLKILSRGYQIMYQEDRLIKSIEDIDCDQGVKIKMHDGVVYADITHKEVQSCQKK